MRLRDVALQQSRLHYPSTQPELSICGQLRSEDACKACPGTKQGKQLNQHRRMLGQHSNVVGTVQCDSGLPPVFKLDVREARGVHRHLHGLGHLPKLNGCTLYAATGAERTATGKSRVLLQGREPTMMAHCVDQPSYSSTLSNDGCVCISGSAFVCLLACSPSGP